MLAIILFQNPEALGYTSQNYVKESEIKRTETLEDIAKHFENLKDIPQNDYDIIVYFTRLIISSLTFKISYCKN